MTMSAPFACCRVRRAPRTTSSTTRSTASSDVVARMRLALRGEVVPAHGAGDVDERALRVVDGDPRGDELEEEVRRGVHLACREERAGGLDRDRTGEAVARRDERERTLLERDGV